MLGVTSKLPSASANGFPNPNRLAYSEMVASPMEAPSWAIGMLQLRRIAVAMLAVAPGPHDWLVELWMKALESGSCSAAGFWNSVSAVALPLSSAAAATTGAGPGAGANQGRH